MEEIMHNINSKDRQVENLMCCMAETSTTWGSAFGHELGGPEGPEDAS